MIRNLQQKYLILRDNRDNTIDRFGNVLRVCLKQWDQIVSIQLILWILLADRRYQLVHRCAECPFALDKLQELN